MPPDTESFERTRLRSGVVFLIIGVVLLLWAWGSWVYRTSESEVALGGVGVDVPPAGAGQASAGGPWASVIVFALVAFLLLLVAFAGYVILRARRRSGVSTDIQPSVRETLAEDPTEATDSRRSNDS